MNKVQDNIQISVVLASYNGALYIKEQIDSILRQDYPFVELLVFDDCSTDDTYNILLEYQHLDSRVKAYRNEKNLGFKKNFEQAIQKCSSPYVALCDQDDVWTDDHLSILVRNLNGKSLVCGNSLMVDSKGNSWNQTIRSIHQMSREYNNQVTRSYFIYYNISVYQGASMLIKKDFLTKVLPIPENVQYHDSYFACIASLLDEMVDVADIVTYYRQHDANVTKGTFRHTNRFRILINHVRYNRPWLNSRLEALHYIENNVSGLTRFQRRFIADYKRYYRNMRSQFGRFLNCFFELMHFRAIFGLPTTKH